MGRHSGINLTGPSTDLKPLREMDSPPAQIQQDYPDIHRQGFRNPHTSLGAAGHWIRMAGIMAPLVIGEIVKDADKRWRWIRISSVATALVSEGLYAQRIQSERKNRAQCQR